MEDDEETTPYAPAGGIDSLYRSIQKDPKLLQRLDEIQFVHTPLHEAVEFEQVDVAVEIMNLMPSLGRKLNPEGMSPLHLAVERRSVRAARALVKLDRELIRVKGREGLTPLHIAAKKNQLDLLASFLFKCPKSIEDLTGRFQTAVHVALESRSFQAFTLLVRWIIRRENNNPVLGWKDEDGNTALHLAVQDDNLEETVKEMVGNIALLNKRNSREKTPLDVAEEHGSETMVKLLKHKGAKRWKELSKVPPLANYLQLPVSWWEALIRDNYAFRKKEAGRSSDATLIVASLVATATYQAALQPPGGLYQGNASATLQALMRRAGRAGTVVMQEETSVRFTAANTFAFTLSMFAMIQVMYSYMSRLNIYLSFILVCVACSYHISVLFITETNAASIVLMAISLYIICHPFLRTVAQKLLDIAAGTEKMYSNAFHLWLATQLPRHIAMLRRQQKILNRE